MLRFTGRNSRRYTGVYHKTVSQIVQHHNLFPDQVTSIETFGRTMRPNRVRKIFSVPSSDIRKHIDCVWHRAVWRAVLVLTHTGEGLEF